MASSKLAICSLPSNISSSARTLVSTNQLQSDGTSWLRFGSDIVYYGETQHLGRLTEAAMRAGLELREYPNSVDPQRLHVVVQKGRLFQLEHPEVLVLIDKGRYLLVELDPQCAQELGKSKVPCYSVRPLEALNRAGAEGPNRIVFESRSRAAEMAARPADPVVQALVARISRSAFEADLTRLVELPTRFSTSAYYTSACDFVEQQLNEHGYAACRQNIVVNGSPSENVVARRQGSNPAQRGLVLVTAHLDSINVEGNATSSAPGADDNGSGSAGVLEIARVLKDYQGANDLEFILFGGEEQGLFGSAHFVASLSAEDRARVSAVVNMDMIATLNTPVACVLLEGAALSQAVIDGLAASAATYTNLSVQTSLNPFNSDHVSFIREGVPAVLTIEGADSANDAIHTGRDTLDRINFDLALEILRMNTAYVVDELGRP